MQGEDREPAIADTLSTVGIDPTAITTRSDAREPVYEVHTASGRYFAKRLQAEKARAMADVLDRDLAVELPNSLVVRDGTDVLVMEPATGTPLSLALPACTLPGLWRLTAASLSRGVRAVGAALGELHAGTLTGERRPDDGSRLADRLHLDRSVCEHLPDRTALELRRLFDDLREMRLPLVRIHGDPTPHNIFWAARTGAVDVIDFNLHRSAAVDDLAVFEAGVELMTARLPHARRSQEATLIEAFRSGYAEAEVHDSIPTRTVAITKAAYYAHLLGKFLRGDSPDTRRERLTRHTDRWIVDRRLQSLVSKL